MGYFEKHKCYALMPFNLFEGFFAVFYFGTRQVSCLIIMYIINIFWYWISLISSSWKKNVYSFVVSGILKSKCYFSLFFLYVDLFFQTIRKKYLCKYLSRKSGANCADRNLFSMTDLNLFSICSEMLKCGGFLETWRGRS